MIKNYNKDILEWDEFPLYDLIWTDPPWNDGMMKFFQTQLKKDTGKILNHTSFDVINHLGKLANVNKPLIIEYSIKGHEDVIKIMELNNHKIISKNYAIQSMGRPFIIMVFNTDIKVDSSKKGPNIIYDTLKDINFNIIFDPFAGIGHTAKAVKKANKIYIGSELNKKRYDKLIKINV